MPQPAAVYIQVHEKVHEQNEEHGVGVYRCDAGLREVHEVKGKYRSAAGGNGHAAEHLLQKNVEQRQHQNADKRAGKAPAERGHAEKLDAACDDELAQRRVRDLVGVDALDMLVCGAGVVYLVKVAAV